MSNFVKKQLPKDTQEKYIKLAYINKDENAKVILFEHNLGLVNHVINTYFKNVPFDENDLFQVGSIGLWNAILNFDITLNLKLNTYATSLIWGEIKKYVTNNYNLLYVPQKTYDLTLKINKLKNEYTNEGKELSIKDISKLLNVDEAEVVLALNSNREIISLHQPAYYNSSNNSEISYEEVIADTNISIEEYMEIKESKEVIKAVIEKLNTKEQAVINVLYQFKNNNISKMELAKSLGLSYYKLTKINENALKKIKKYIINNDYALDLFQIEKRNVKKKI